MKNNCVFCGMPSADGKNHHSCAEAWGLDYNPQSEEDAKAWLQRRRERIEDALVDNIRDLSPAERRGDPNPIV
jgi:hypothetical protein